MVRHAAKLSPADQVCPQVHAAILVGYRNDNVDRAYEVMAEGLRRLVRDLPYLSGRIVRGEQGYTHLLWDDNVTGDEVKLERIDARKILPPYQVMADRGMDLHAYDYDFPLEGVCTREFQPKGAEPALLVGMYEVDGGYIIKFAGYHHIADGHSLLILYNHWAAVAIGREPDVPLDPAAPLTRYTEFVEGTGLQPSPHHKLAYRSGADIDIDESNLDAERAPAPFPSTGKVIDLGRELFVIADEQIAELRQAVTKAGGGKKPSTMSLVAALFWVLLCEVREHRNNNQAALDPTDEAQSSMLMAAQARASFPDLDQFFIGNFITPAFITDTIKNLVVAPSVDAAAHTSDDAYAAVMARACQTVTASIRDALEPDLIRPKLQFISNIPDARLLAGAGGNPMRANDIFLSSWMNFSLYPDFGPGVGVQDCVRGATTGSTTERATYSYLVILPRRTAPDGQTIFEVFLCCELEDMRALQQHPFLKKRLYTKPVFRTAETKARL